MMQEQLTDIGVPHSECRSRGDLVDTTVCAGGSSAVTCSICYEDYCTHDVMRVLPCEHRFHVDCIDEWLLGKPKPGDTRRFVCPLCSHPLDQL
jgi:hypothetical protein